MRNWNEVLLLVEICGDPESERKPKKLPPRKQTKRRLNLQIIIALMRRLDGRCYLPAKESIPVMLVGTRSLNIIALTSILSRATDLVAIGRR